jgi:hypothetical protein
MPIMTMTWFQFQNDPEKQGVEDHYKMLVHIVRQRIRKMLHTNPWLQGTFVKESGKAYIAYPHYTHVDDILVVLERDRYNVSPLAYSRPLEENTHELYQYSRNIRQQQQQQQQPLVLQIFQDQHQPFWRVSIIPCRNHPESHFSIVVSMSHVIGDGHTFYRLYEQLLHEDDDATASGSFDTGSYCLIAERILNTQQLQLDYMNHQINVLETFGFVACMIRGVLCQRLFGERSFFRRISLKLYRSRNVRCRPSSPYRMKTRVVLLDPHKLADAKQNAINSEHTTTLTADSSIPNNGVSFVSTNDVLTSWFLTNANCPFGLMAVNVRNKIEHHTDQHAGNYENCILYHPPNDTSTPALIRRSLHARSRGISNDVYSTSNDNAFSDWKLATSDLALITNWSTFAPFRHVKDDNKTKMGSKVVLPRCQQLFHAPALDYNTLMPSSLATCVIFQATHDQLGMILCAKEGIIKQLEKTLPRFTSTTTDKR